MKILRTIQNMKYRIKVKDNVVFRTTEKKKALQAVAKLFRDGQTDIYLDANRIGTWWNE